MATKGDTSDLNVLSFGGVPLVPQVSQGGFSRSRQSGVTRTNSAGGASRQRKKYYGTTHIAEVNFYLQDAQLQDFFELFVVNNEGKRFICHLVADRALVEPYVVQIISEVNYSEVNAHDAIASMTLEIFSARDAVLDDFLLTMYDLYGSDYATVLNLINDVQRAIPYD